MRGSSAGAAALNVVLVDMDGVLADFETPNNRIVETFGARVISERSDFYYADSYRQNTRLLEMIYLENRRCGFFREFPVVDGALEGWQRILDAGFRPRVCSSPLENHETVVAEKKAWLKEYFAPYFGDWVVDSAIFSRDKSGYNACAMIDDRPTLRNSEAARWQHVVFDCSYNRSVVTNFRLRGWADPRLEELLTKCRDKYRHA